MIVNDLNQQLTQKLHELIPEAGFDYECGTCEGSGEEPRLAPGDREVIRTRIADCEVSGKVKIFFVQCWSCKGKGGGFDEPLLRHVLWAIDVKEGLWSRTPVPIVERLLRDYWNLQHNLYGQTTELKQFLLNLLKNE